MQQPLVAGLRWTAGLAGMAIVAVLAAACGSGSPPASSAPSAPADVSVALGKLVQCLHTHASGALTSVTRRLTADSHPAHAAV